MTLRNKLHVWAADHFAAVQYPRITQMSPRLPVFGFKYKMQMLARFQLLVMSLALLAIGLLMLFAVGVLAYCLM